MALLEEMLGYLPEYLREFEEIRQLLAAEDPHITALVDASVCCVDEQYIQTATDYGLSKFESLLGIHPDPTATLDERRKTVLAMWFNSLPFTERQLKNRIIALQGDDNVDVSVDYGTYDIAIATRLLYEGQVSDLMHILRTMVPANMTYAVENLIPWVSGTDLYPAGGATALTTFTTISDIYVPSENE
jgi:hypothetical protein